VVAAAIGLAVAVAVVRPRRVVVEGPSMEPTLKAGDRLLVLRRSTLALGDIVAFEDPGGEERLLVKRVVEVIGRAVVVEGDNRGSSTDSRVFGPVEAGAVIGRAVYRYGPAGRTGLLV